jgi:hypothetical protein
MTVFDNSSFISFYELFNTISKKDKNNSKFFIFNSSYDINNICNDGKFLNDSNINKLSNNFDNVFLINYIYNPQYNSINKDFFSQREIYQ